MKNEYLESVIKQFKYYKALGEKTFEQLNDEDLNWKATENSNSIAMLVNHLSGNMLSRWTDFLQADGEKPWRNRDQEFADIHRTRTALLEQWEAGWSCLLCTLLSLDESDLNSIIYIRNEGHTVSEAINRQLAHYPYHIGQIVFIGKFLSDRNWNSLSIPLGDSARYNAKKFEQDRTRKHFTDNV